MQSSYLFIFIVIIAISVFAFYQSFGIDGNIVKSSKDKITVYKSESCGCCGSFTSYLKNNGFEVDTINAEMNSIKKKYNIPKNMQSCHTAIIGEYFIEGHVPIEAVNKLLNEKPDIDGIALPGMLSGSPGMPGIKKEIFKIYAINNGKVSEFMKI